MNGGKAGERGGGHGGAGRTGQGSRREEEIAVGSVVVTLSTPPPAPPASHNASLNLHLPTETKRGGEGGGGEKGVIPKRKTSPTVLMEMSCQYFSRRE